MSLTVTDILIGTLNIAAALASLSAAASNCIVYGLTLRLIGVVVVLSISGAALFLLEILPRPTLVRRYASHLVSYPGRAIHYLFLALLATDSVGWASVKKYYELWSWINAATLAATALLFGIFTIAGLILKGGMPLPRSMRKRTRDGKHQLIQGNTDVDEVTVERKERTRQFEDGRTASFFSTRSPGHDPFERIPSDASSRRWSPTSPYSSLARPLKPAHSSPDRSSLGGPCPSPSFVQQSTMASSRYGDHMQTAPLSAPSGQRMPGERVGTGVNRPSTASSVKSGKWGLLGRGLESRDQSREYKDTISPPSQQGFRADRPRSISSMRYETTQDRLGLGSPVPSLQVEIGDLSQMSEARPFHHQLQFEAMEVVHNNGGYETRKDPLQCAVKPSKQVERTKGTRKHRRVFVPSVGTVDLSSGSESEGENVSLARTGEANGDDSDSVYSLSSDCEPLDVGSAPASLGRRLTRTETRKHRGKLERGMQRALSHKGNERDGQGRARVTLCKDRV